MTERIFITVDEVAAKLNISPHMVRNYCSLGKLTAHFIADKWRIPTYAVRQYEERTLNNGRQT